MNWSAGQQRLLRALGHDLMVHGTQWPPSNVAPQSIPAAAMAAAVNSTARSFPKAALAGPAAAKPGASTGNQRLQEALRRAAGGNDISAFVDDIEKLRNQPALKRALWPRLRALRRSH